MSRDSQRPSGAASGSRSSSQEPKRPAATLDLEATEIKSEENQPKSSKSGSAAQSEAAKTEKKNIHQKADQDHETLMDRAKSVFQDGQDFQAIASHLAAGVVGGAVMLIGAYSFLANSGTPENVQEQITETVEKKLAAFEKSGSELDSGTLLRPLNEKISAISGRLDNIEKSVDELSEAQSDLQNSSANLEKELTRTGSVYSQSEERLARLEKTIGSLTAEGQSGEASQLEQAAALSARITELDSQLNERLTKHEKDVETKIAEIYEGMPSESTSGVTQQDIETVKRTMQAGTDRLNEDLLTVRSDARLLGDELSSLRSQNLKLANEIKELRATLLAVSGQSLKSEELQGQLNPIASRLESLERKVVSLIANDEKQQANARQTALPVALNNLKRAIDNGSGFSEELELVEELAPIKLQTGPLKNHAVTGVESLNDLQQTFPSVIRKVIDSNSTANDGTFVDRFISSAKSVVRIRKTGDIEGSDKEAVIARMETRLKNNDLEGTLRESRGLKGPAAKAAEPWLEQARARFEVNNALEKLERQLLTAFTGKEAVPAKEN